MKTFKWILFFLAAFSGAFAHEGEDHSPQKAQQTVARSYFTVNSVSTQFELVLRYEPLKANEPASMTLFISDFATNRPIHRAVVEVSSREGDLKFKAVPVDTGVYRIEGTFPENKPYILLASVSAAGKADLMTLDHVEVGLELPVEDAANTWVIMLLIPLAFLLGIVLTWFMLRNKKVVRKRKAAAILLLLILLFPSGNLSPVLAHGEEDHSPKAKTGNTGSDQMEILKETQFLFDIETMFAGYAAYRNVLKLYGKVMPTTTGEARIMAPQPGHIRQLYVTVGQRVSKGEALAIIEQSISAAEQVQIASEKSAVQGEVEQARKDYQRLKGLEGIVAKKEIVAAEVRYQTALKKQRAYASVSTGGGTRALTITSPIDGVVGNFNLSTGQMLQQGQELFSVIDNARLKIEAQVFADDRDKITDRIRFMVSPTDGAKSSAEAKLIAFDKVIDPLTQSSKVILELSNFSGFFRSGQFVHVDVVTFSDLSQIAVPSSAVTDINGKPAVFVHTRPEEFAIRFIQPGESNARETVVLKGLEKHERVVINGTYQVKSIYLNQ